MIGVFLIIVFQKCFLTKPNCLFCEFYTDSATRTPPLFFFSFFISFDCSDKILTFLKTCFWNPATYRPKIVRLSSAQFGLVMFENDFQKISNGALVSNVI